MDTINDLHLILDAHFDKYSLAPVSGGATNAVLFKLTENQTENFILKLQPCHESNISLQSDKNNYEWLKGKVPVPAIAFYHKFEGFELLCLSEIQGQPLANFFKKIDAREIIKRYANSLRLLHSLKIDRCPFIQDLDQRLEKANYNLENGLVDLTDLQPENKPCELRRLFEKLLKNKPANPDLVFTHGDYCFDNLIYNETELNGFIDLGNGGVADRYQDIALAIRNIRDHFSDELVDLFCGEYGISKFDNPKVEFYTLLDEFF